MKLFDAISVHRQIVTRIVGSETVILDLESGTYFGLDNVARGSRAVSIFCESRGFPFSCE
jgi:hypothetical protein